MIGVVPCQAYVWFGKYMGVHNFVWKQKAVVLEAHNSKLGEYYWVGDNKNEHFNWTMNILTGQDILRRWSFMLHFVHHTESKTIFSSDENRIIDRKGKEKGLELIRNVTA